MKLSAWMTDCPLPDLHWLRQENPQGEVLFCLPASAQEVPARHAVYVGQWEQMPACVPHADFCCLCTGAAPDEAALSLRTGCNVLHTAASPQEALRAAAQGLAPEQLLNAARAQLIEAHAQNKGLQRFIDAAYSVLENPIVLVDTSYKILALNDDLAKARPDLARQQELGYMLEANIEEMRRLHLYEKARERYYPYYSREETSHRGWMTALVYSDGIEVAQMGVLESNREFAHADFELVHFLCRLVALELQKTDFYATNSGLMHSVLMHDLLEGVVRSEESAAARSAPLGWVIGNEQQVLIVFDQNYGVFDRKARTVCEALRGLLPQCHWVIYQNKLVFLLPHPLLDDDALVQYLRVNHLYAALSERFRGLLPLRNAFSQALHAYEHGMRLAPDKTLHRYTDYMFHHIGQLLAGQQDVRVFCHPGVLQLAEYDSENATQLLPTLRAYLRWNDNPTAAARQLYIHKNTLFYRINKIKEQFGLQLTDGNERARIQLTLAFLESAL